jgi:hypothetical protein
MPSRNVFDVACSHICSALHEVWKGHVFNTIGIDDQSKLQVMPHWNVSDPSWSQLGGSLPPLQQGQELCGSWCHLQSELPLLSGWLVQFQLRGITMHPLHSRHIRDRNFHAQLLSMQ